MHNKFAYHADIMLDAFVAILLRWHYWLKPTHVQPINLKLIPAYYN